MTNRRRKLIKEQKGRCLVCGTELDKPLYIGGQVSFHASIHHIYPVRHGGLNDLSNLVLLHDYCHGKIEKGNIEEWGMALVHHKKTGFGYGLLSSLAHHELHATKLS